MHRLKRLTGLFVATIALLMVPAAAAQADPFELDITDAVLDLGNLSGVKAIDSSIPDPPATLDGTITGTSVTIPKAGFVFPTKSAEVTTGITANIDMEANNDITGTFNAATGEMSLDVSLKATVAIPNFSSTCVISPIALVLSTENGKPYIGEKFTAGLTGPGAFSASWNALPPVTGGGFCPTVAGLIAGPGGIWMSQDIQTAKTCVDVPSHPGCGVSKPDKAPSITAGPTGSSDSSTAEFKFAKAADETQDVSGFKCSLDGGAFEACDGGTKSYTGLAEGEHKFEVKASNSAGEGPVASRSWTYAKAPLVGNLSKPKVTFKPKAVKKGKKATMSVQVKNTGSAAVAGVSICVKAPAKFVKVKKCTSVGSIAAGKTVTKKISVKAKKKKGTAKLTVTATGSGVAKKTATAKLKIK